MNKDTITSQVCPDKEMNGDCTKGAECPICNKGNQTESKPQQEEGNLNIHAATYVPKKKKVPEKLDFNLAAKEYVPKKKEEGEEEPEEDDLIDEQMDMRMKDVVEDDMVDELAEDSEDEDKWYPKYKDCPCCKGFVYKCNGDSCKSLGQCYGKMKDDCEEM